VIANWLQQLDAAWARRHAGPAQELPGDAGREPAAVITGASEGIGRALADEFAKAGHRLLLIARNGQALEDAAEALRRDYGATVHTAAIDLTAADALARVDAALNQAGLYADILVNNAGMGLGGPFAEQDSARLDALVRLNIGALTALTRRFLPDMLRRARGGVLNIASLGGLLPGPYQAAYYASKAYVVSLTEALAHENAGCGVRICAATPGPVATGFHAKMGVGNANYLKLQSVMNANSAARVIYSGFIGRRTLIAPGVMATFNFHAIGLIPHVILVPFIGWLLKQRY
jgi:hypothetical protein